MAAAAIPIAASVAGGLAQGMMAGGSGGAGQSQSQQQSQSNSASYSFPQAILSPAAYPIVAQNIAEASQQEQAAIGLGNTFVQQTENPYIQASYSAMDQLMESLGLPVPQGGSYAAAMSGGPAAQSNMMSPSQEASGLQAQLDADPGYQFQLNQGLNAIQGVARAQGLAGSPNILQQAAQFTTGLASNELSAYRSNLANILGIGQSASSIAANSATGTAQELATVLGQAESAQSQNVLAKDQQFQVGPKPYQVSTSTSSGNGSSTGSNGPSTMQQIGGLGTGLIGGLGPFLSGVGGMFGIGSGGRSSSGVPVGVSDGPSAAGSSF